VETKKTTSKYLTPSEKEKIIGFLTNAFSTDIINLDEFESRVESVHAAKTHEELHAIVADLPNEDIDDRKKIAECENIVCNMGTRTIAGSMLFAKKLKIEATSSSLNLDYRSVELPDGVYSIYINAVASSITIKLPVHYNVENRISSELSSVVKEPKIAIGNQKISVTIELVGNIKSSSIKVVKVRKPFWSRWLKRLKKHDKIES
jgi:energy-converting hydrogenase Eha subunit A